MRTRFEHGEIRCSAVDCTVILYSPVESIDGEKSLDNVEIECSTTKDWTIVALR